MHSLLYLTLISFSSFSGGGITVPTITLFTSVPRLGLDSKKDFSIFKSSSSKIFK